MDLANVILGIASGAAGTKIIDLVASSIAQAREARREDKQKPVSEEAALRKSRIWWMERTADTRSDAAQKGVALVPIDLDEDPYPPK